MTTLIYDPKGKALWTDTHSHSGSLVTNRAISKLAYVYSERTDFLGNTLGHCIVATAGYDTGYHRLIKYLIDLEYPATPDPDRDNYGIILIITRAGGMCHIRSSEMFIHSEDPLVPYTEGSGGGVAQIMLATGASAREALDMCKRLDAYTGGHSDVATFVNGVPTITRIESGKASGYGYPMIEKDLCGYEAAKAAYKSSKDKHKDEHPLYEPPVGYSPNPYGFTWAPPYRKTKQR